MTDRNKTARRTGIIIVSAILGGLLNRWRGHASKYKFLFPRPLPQIVLSLPYGYACIHAGLPWWVATIAFVGALLGWTTGHGQYFPDLSPEHVKPERLDFLLRPFFGKDPRHFPRADEPPEFFNRRIDRYGRFRLALRCMLGMSLTGLVVTIGAGIALHSIPLAITGALKGPAYQIARLFGWGPEGGEYLAGAVLIGSLALIYQFPI